MVVVADVVVVVGRIRYEATRSDFDDATPPLIPSLMRQHAVAGLARARQCPITSSSTVTATGGRPSSSSSQGHGTVAEEVPDTVHDTCIVNFYPIGDHRIEAVSGRLGVHVDKDEDVAVRQRGDPIVSLSIGDAADFAYGSVHFDFDPKSGAPVVPPPVRPSGSVEQQQKAAEEQPQVVRLESGDLLVFGGAARMVHHGVAGIVAGSAPPWLRMAPGRLNFTFRSTGKGEAY